ncbi:copper-translocating P-type ATPase [Atopobacter phocae]|uniref:copper-translocating P-type ATPase n=1 Tax=Atopobacter phocae TaxID=136492 RepID=UPI0004701E30|nr:copper-translocating P-type ATPase [Atopobacter phocae]
MKKKHDGFSRQMNSTGEKTSMMYHDTHEHHDNHYSHASHQTDSHHHHHQHMIEDFKRRFIFSIILTVPILVLSPMIQNGLNYSFTFSGQSFLLWLLSTILYFYGGWPFITGMKDELKQWQPGMMTLIFMAITVAYSYSSAIVFGLSGQDFFWELATLIDIMLLGHWIEMRSVLSASNALEKLVDLMSDIAHVSRPEGVIDINRDQIKPNDHLIIKPGEKVPADGIIVEGTSYIDESMLTGEVRPVEKTVGDALIGGAINGSGTLEVAVNRIGKDTYLSQVIRLVQQAQDSKSRTQDLANRAAFWLTIIALTVGVLTFIVWYAITRDIAFAIARMATVMIITCPHALGLATPLVVATSTAQAAKNGLLIRNRSAFETSRQVNVVVFDKTGTLTQGQFEVDEIQVFDSHYTKDAIIQFAGTLESYSEHPIASGILKQMKERQLSHLPVGNVQALKGKGLSGQVDGHSVFVVSPGYLTERGIAIPNQQKSDSPLTQVFLLVDHQLVGAISLSDQIRPSAYSAIQRLHNEGIQTWMLTGDNEHTAKKVADELGINGYFANVLPHEKQDKIKELQKQGNIVAMTGDGVNDAPALAQADVGIAIGSGTDIASETADIILVNSNPEDVVTLIRFGRATYRKMIQNLIWATGYNILAIPLAAGILSNIGIVISPAIGAVFMSLSTIIVAFNAKLLKLERSPKK